MTGWVISSDGKACGYNSNILKNPEDTCDNFGLRVATLDEANGYKSEMFGFNYPQSDNMICTADGKYIHSNGNTYDRTGYLATSCYAFTCMISASTITSEPTTAETTTGEPTTSSSKDYILK